MTIDGSPDSQTISTAEAEAKAGHVKAALSQLMEASAWLSQSENIDSLPEADRANAILLHIQVGTAITQMQNSTLEKIMATGEDAMSSVEQATADLKETMGKIDMAARFLSAVTTLVGFAARFA